MAMMEDDPKRYLSLIKKLKRAGLLGQPSPNQKNKEKSEITSVDQRVQHVLKLINSPDRNP